MTIKLNKNEVCIYSSTCPYNNNTTNSICQGATLNRPNEFVCDLASECGVFNEGKFRSQFDTTGKMKIILEGK